MTESPDVLPAGTVLDGTYRLTRLLGQGGMGAVYEGHHTGAGKRVAVKIMHRELLAYPELAARFRREAKVTSELAHPHIVNVFGFGATPAGQPYIVMEFLDGEDLQTRLERVGALPPETVVPIVNQVASALAEAHAAGVVHRDLKPDNVFLVRAPDGAVFAKVVDFGLSKVLKTSATKLTVARAVFGTPEFMAPEQAEGRQDAIDHRSDQWSLACLAWFASTACLPFAGPDVNAVLNQVISAVPTPVGPGAPRIPAEVDKVLRRALSKDRAERFPTIRAFARAFEAATSGIDRDAEPPRHTPAPSRAMAPERPAADARRAEPQSRKRGRRGGTWLALAVALAILGGAGWLLRDEPPIATWLRQARDLLHQR
ncbi:MAG TPA: serine/threonine-protein kinase [Polyangia bacterium]|jgi:serine/threonine-protein kinase|nr:serine/threonine-protein kinase [Polyangia bacterium]